jgi:hypothetical protein
MEQCSMIKLLFILLFSASLNAATLIQNSHPTYYLDMGDEVYSCTFGFMDEPINCLGVHKKTKINVKYVCVKARSEDGFIKDCKTKQSL